MMPLRQAKKLVKLRRQLQTWEPSSDRERKAIRRYLRWPGRRLAHHHVDGLLCHFVLDRLGRPGRFTGDLLDWTLIHSIEHRVEWTELRDGTWISTVFLGMDHNFRDILFMRGGSTTPVLFETMVQLPGKSWDEQHRYTTLHDARVGHATLVARLSSTVADATETPWWCVARKRKLTLRTQQRLHKAFARLRRMLANNPPPPHLEEVKATA